MRGWHARDARQGCLALQGGGGGLGRRWLVGVAGVEGVVWPGFGRQWPASRRPHNQRKRWDLPAYLVDRVAPERLEALRGLLQIDLRPKGGE